VRVEQPALDRDACPAHVEVEVRIRAVAGRVRLGDVDGEEQHPACADVHLEAMIGRRDQDPFAGLEREEDPLALFVDGVGVLWSAGGEEGRGR
jgi:hypothetical protein